MCYVMASCSFSTSSTRASLVTNLVIKHEWRKNRIVITTNETFVTQIFHNSLPSHGGNRKTLEVMTSTQMLETLGSVASLQTATLYHGHHDRNNISRLIDNIAGNTNIFVHL